MNVMRPLLVAAVAFALAGASAGAQTIYQSADTAAFNYMTVSSTFVGTGTDTITFATYQLPSFYLVDNITIPGVALINGSFEDGDFTGFTQTGDISYTGVSDDFEGYLPTNGTYEGYFGQIYSSGFLQQTFLDTAGVTYTVSFDVADLFTGPSAFCAFIDTPSTDCPTPGVIPPPPPLPTGATPEPSSLVLLGTGALSLAGAARRKFRKA